MSNEQPSEKLTTKQRAFVHHYLACHNGAEAARRAGYSEASAKEQASRMLTFVNIRAAIQAGIREIMPAAEVVQILAAQARGSMRDFLRVDEEEVTISATLVAMTEAQSTMLALEGSEAVQRMLTDLRDQDEAAQGELTPKAVLVQTATIKRAVARLDLLQGADKLSLIKKYTLDDKGKVSIELYDAHAAAVDIGKMHGLFVDRHEVSGPDGGPVPLQVTATDLAQAREKAKQFEDETIGE